MVQISFSLQAAATEVHLEWGERSEDRPVLYRQAWQQGSLLAHRPLARVQEMEHPPDAPVRQGLRRKAVLLLQG